jgi:UDP-2,3-diacylglucosamine pyrophosphatase LpxH
MADRARSLGAQGVICGHIHQPVIRERDGMSYMNCGDWVEHCTALVEHWDGRFELVTDAELSPQLTGPGQAEAVSYALAARPA